MGIETLIGAGISAFGAYQGNKNQRRAQQRMETAAAESARRNAEASSQAGSMLSDAEMQGAQLQAQGFNTAADQRVSGLQQGMADQRRMFGRQNALTRQGMAGQREMFNRQNALQQPFIQGGLSGQDRYMELLGLGGDPNAAGFGRYGRDPTQDEIMMDPGYQFRLSEGLKALDRSAAAGAGLQSGSALKAAARYGQGFASNEYGNAFDRFQVNRSNQLTPLQLLMAQGQGASNVATDVAGRFGQDLYRGSQDLSDIAGNFGNALYRTNRDIGDIRGQGTMGAALANAGGVSNAARARAMGLTGSAGFLSGGETDAANAFAAGMAGRTNALNANLGQAFNFYQGNNIANALRNRGVPNANYGQMSPGLNYRPFTPDPNANIG